MSYRAEVDHALCTGYAECARMAPAAFKLNDDNQSEPIADIQTADPVLLAAAQDCPTNAIRVLDPDGTTIYDSG